MDITCVIASLGDVPSSYQLLLIDPAKVAWADSSIYPRIVSITDAICTAEEFEKSAINLATSPRNVAQAV